MLLLAPAVALVGCAAPPFTFVADSPAGTYFEVPRQWQPVNSTALAQQLGFIGGAVPKGMWLVGYDSASRPSPSHVLSAEVSQPFAFAWVVPLNGRASNAMSYNNLRDFIFPVTSLARQGQSPGGGSGFRLFSDSVITSSQGIHGIREIFQLTTRTGRTDIFDQIAFTNANDTTAYVLMVHCLASCYLHNRGEIDTVMTSFTVRPH
jgi:hypothetical protein